MKNKSLIITLALFFILVSALALFGCNPQPDYLSYVSEVRKDLFYGEQENYTVVCYAGIKESPAIFDGAKNQTAPYIRFKLSQKEESSEKITINFEIDNKKLSCPLEFHPVKSTLFGEVQVNSLPERSITIDIVCGENTTTVTLYSKLNEDTISYTDALKKATDKASDFLKEHTKKGVLKAEIVIRLLCENDKNFYYVGFICEEGLKRAYLIDGKTGEIIAEKNN
ncbi:MAG: hypothetical protein IKT32_05125 [Clostridia bacterium]|nr:hypothetical protein [Clostridia bacterium]